MFNIKILPSVSWKMTLLVVIFKQPAYTSLKSLQEMNPATH